MMIEVPLSATAYTYEYDMHIESSRLDVGPSLFSLRPYEKSKSRHDGFRETLLVTTGSCHVVQQISLTYTSYPEIAIAGALSCSANGLLSLSAAVIGRLQQTFSNKNAVTPALYHPGQGLAKDSAAAGRHVQRQIALSGRFLLVAVPSRRDEETKARLVHLLGCNRNSVARHKLESVLNSHQ